MYIDKIDPVIILINKRSKYYKLILMLSERLYPSNYYKIISYKYRVLQWSSG